MDLGDWLGVEIYFHGEERTYRIDKIDAREDTLELVFVRGTSMRGLCERIKYGDAGLLVERWQSQRGITVGQPRRFCYSCQSTQEFAEDDYMCLCCRGEEE